MPSQETLREHLVRLLDWEDAHRGFDAVMAEWPSHLRGIRPPGCSHSAWQLLEHLRICQWDILEFSRDPGHVSPEFPDGCWPPREMPSSDAEWTESVARFQSDRAAMQRLLADPEVDLFAPIPHGQGQTILREALLVADHNAYHLGQLLLLGRLLGNWPTDP